MTAGLYAVGALAAPPERVTLIPADPEAEVGGLRSDLDSLLAQVDAQHDRMPGDTVARVHEIAEILAGVMERPTQLAADPEIRHEITRIARLDLPQSVQIYLNLPRWFAVTAHPGGERSATDELLTQLDLLSSSARQAAERFYANDVREQQDLSRYLDERDRER